MTQNSSNIVINSSFGAYSIKFQPIEIEQFENSYFLADQTLKEYVNLDRDKSVVVPVKEVNKTLELVENIMVQLSAKGMTKKNDLVVIGGGFLQDIGTLVASLYMRGVKWKYVPTTLAAMGDSCIGGKSSINAGAVKNLVGNFYPPGEVLINSSFVSTLPNIEIIAGISEIIKICFARSFETFAESIRLISDWNTNGNLDSLSQLIQLSLYCKKYFVEKDEFDVGIRRLLNFGHSFGHALESASNYKIPHGIAILIGMLAASQHPLSEPSSEKQLLVKNCLAFGKLIGEDILSEISSVDYEAFSRALAKDKKNSSSHLVLVLPLVSRLDVIEIPFKDDALQTASRSMNSAIEMVLNEIR